MFFTYPFMLIGIVAAGIPLIFHLLDRRRAPEVAFPSLIFLTQSAEENARRRKIRDILLLIIRMAAVTCLALALADPRIGGGKTDRNGSDEGFSTVIILEDNLNQGDTVRVPDRMPGSLAAGEETTRFAMAKQIADYLVSRFKPGRSQAAIITVCGRAGDPEWISDPADAQARIRALTPSGAQPNIRRALADADRLLKSAVGPVRELVWIGPGEADPKRFTTSLPPHTRVLWINTQTTPPEDCAITSPRIRPVSRLMNSDWRAEFGINNRSINERETTLTVYPDLSGSQASGSPSVTSTVRIPPRSPKSVAVTIPADWLSNAHTQADGSTLLVCRAALTNDDNMLNNALPFAITIPRRRTAVIVESAAALQSGRASGFYVAAALDYATVLSGKRASDDTSSSPVGIARIFESQLTPGILQHADAIIWAASDTPSPKQATLLKRAVSTGVTLIVFPPPSHSGLSDFNAGFGIADQGGLLPAHYMTWAGDLIRSHTTHANMISASNPPAWWPRGTGQDSGGHTDLFRSVPVWRSVTTRSRDPEHNTILLLTDRPLGDGIPSGLPLVLFRQHGAGGVVQITVDAQGNGSGLPASKAWPPLLHALVELNRKTLNRSVCGDVPVPPNPVGSAGEWRAWIADKPIPVTRSGNTASIRVDLPSVVQWFPAGVSPNRPGTDTPGATTIVVPYPAPFIPAGTRHGAEILTAMEALSDQPDAFSKIDSAALNHPSESEHAGSLADMVSRFRRGVSLKDGLLSLVLGLLLLELWLARQRRIENAPTGHRFG